MQRVDFGMKVIFEDFAELMQIVAIRHAELVCWDSVSVQETVYYLLITRTCIIRVQWNLGYTSKLGLKNLDVKLRGTYK